MGLFSNNKKLCPLCGAPTPRLLATKVEDMPLCKECANKIDLPGGALNTMSLADVEKYMTVYEENRARREQFTETLRRSFGFLSGTLTLDTDHRLFRVGPGDGAFAFGPENLKAFRILEDGKVLFEGRDGVLYCHYSDVADRAAAMQPAIDRFYMDVHEYERMEDMDRRMHRDGDDRPVRFRPTFDMKAPAQKFTVELTLAHPYWHNFREETGAPDFDSYDPSVAEYLNEYEDEVNGLHELAAALLHIMDANGAEQWDDVPGGQTAQADSTAAAAAAAAAAAVAAVQASAAPAVDAVAEIQKYKALLDAGVLTEEEFTAKKRQLLGI
mgnify:FL=1